MLEEGFVQLGALPVGESVSGAFGIWVRENADPSRPFLLDLTVGDAVLRVTASDEMRLKVLPNSGERADAKSVLQVDGDPLKLRAGAHASAAVAADVAVGTALSFEGKVGPWLYTVAPDEPSRRWFVAEDQGGLSDAGGAKASSKGKGSPRSPPAALPIAHRVASTPTTTRPTS